MGYTCPVKARPIAALLPLCLLACPKEKAASPTAPEPSVAPEPDPVEPKRDLLGPMDTVGTEGMRFDLPTWGTRREEGDLELGSLATMEPSPGVRGVMWGWSRESLRTDVELDAPLEKLSRYYQLPLRMEGSVPSRTPLRSSQTALGVVDIPEVDARIAVTVVACPDDPRTLALVSVFDASENEVLEAHETLLQSVECGPPPDLAPNFPLYRGPHPTSSYVDPMGLQGRIKDISYVDLKLVDPETAARLADDPAARAADLRKQGYVLEDAAAKLPPLSGDDPQRKMWRITLRRAEAMSAGEFDLVFGTLTCGSHPFVFTLRPIDRRIDALSCLAAIA
jgi:hypothetical protein